MNYRVYVEKKPGFEVESKSMLKNLNTNLELNLTGLRIINTYDLFGFSESLLKKALYKVFGEIVTDHVSLELDLEGCDYIAIEYLPGQFDQRADAAVSCCHLINPKAHIKISSSKIIIIEGASLDDIQKIKHYLINPVESREKDLSILAYNDETKPLPVKEISNFLNYNEEDAKSLISTMGLAMSVADLKCVIDYFKSKGRNPNETEIRIIDTYWSDHCRHTTFNTVLDKIEFEDSFISPSLKKAYELYLEMKHTLKRDLKPTTLMDMACIGARFLKKKGYLKDLEESTENNACSIFVDVLEDGKKEKWLLQFKNETHNHPTEIEPFGGASTCLGGAIRDPLSGRSYVYQAMRVTGAGDIYKEVKDTIKGKLPQRVISQQAAAGYSSYGNQIGLATTHVKEIYHEGYTAKRMEVGAVVGAVKYENIIRQEPSVGDVIIMFGGRTGRDGIGGATGSSKEHNQKSIETCSSEVQKGNAPEERKIERLFARPEVTKIVKKSNDFGAGGVSVAIGELAPSLDIYLDRVPVKYKGLNPTELAISESQERMAVCISKENISKFMEYCHEENLEATYVADVTDTGMMNMYYNGHLEASLDRTFIDSAGATHHAEVIVEKVEEKNPFKQTYNSNLHDSFLNNLASYNVLSQKGLVEMFDSTIGASTILMPYGGKYQLSETQVSCQKLPTRGVTNTSSMMAFGYNPNIASFSPYHGAQYAVVEAVSKLVAAGASIKNVRFSYQEYFKKMTDAKSFGLPFAALLGAIKAQNALCMPSIGGKDSMSGTYLDKNVPPTLVAFGITTLDAKDVISTDFKKEGHYLYLINPGYDSNYEPNYENLIELYNKLHKDIKNKNVVSAYALGFGGLGEALAKMSFGNKVGFEVLVDEESLFDLNYGAILVEAKNPLAYAECLGRTSSIYKINDEEFTYEEMVKANFTKFGEIYPAISGVKGTLPLPLKRRKRTFVYEGEAHMPVVYAPAFPGTNCDFDTLKAFRLRGAKTISSVFKNLTEEDVTSSIEEMASLIDKADIFVLSGGFSAGDEPDGSAKFIANVLTSPAIKASIANLLKRKGLILGICNGFQALVKSGLLPDAKLGALTQNSPTLFRNDINRHVSQMVKTRVSSNRSPWLSSFKLGDEFTIPVSHGEGKFVVSDEQALKLFENGQVAFQYVDYDGAPTMTSPMNPNGSSYAIEGIISKSGLILGKMGHTERYNENLYKNINGNKNQDIFTNAINYFLKK